MMFYYSGHELSQICHEVTFSMALPVEICWLDILWCNDIQGLWSISRILIRARQYFARLRKNQKQILFLVFRARMDLKQAFLAINYRHIAVELCWDSETNFRQLECKH